MLWTRRRTNSSGAMPLLLIRRMFSLRRFGEIESTLWQVILSGYLKRPSTSSQTHPQFFRHSGRERRRKCISNLAISTSFLSGELPLIRKSLQTRNHPNSEPRHAYKVPGRWLICNSLSVHTECGPSSSRSRWSKVRAAMLERAADYCRCNFVCLLAPRLCTFPAMLDH